MFPGMLQSRREQLHRGAAEILVSCRQMLGKEIYTTGSGLRNERKESAANSIAGRGENIKVWKNLRVTKTLARS
jgi:hypothetical protein